MQLSRNLKLALIALILVAIGFLIAKKCTPAEVVNKVDERIEVSKNKVKQAENTYEKNRQNVLHKDSINVAISDDSVERKLTKVLETIEQGKYRFNNFEAGKPASGQKNAFKGFRGLSANSSTKGFMRKHRSTPKKSGNQYFNKNRGVEQPTGKGKGGFIKNRDP